MKNTNDNPNKSDFLKSNWLTSDCHLISISWKLNALGSPAHRPIEVQFPVLSHTTD